MFKLRAFRETRRSGSLADDEQFHLVTGFNEVFVSLAILMAVLIPFPIAASASPFLAQGAMAVAAWGLSDYFVRKRRMALPAIILLFAFIASFGMFGFIVGNTLAPMRAHGLPLPGVALGLAASGLPAALHWALVQGADHSCAPWR